MIHFLKNFEFFEVARTVLFAESKPRRQRRQRTEADKGQSQNIFQI